MPSPSADTKFVLSIFKYLCQLEYLLDHLSMIKRKELTQKFVCTQNTDGLGISLFVFLWWQVFLREWEKIFYTYFGPKCYFKTVLIPLMHCRNRKNQHDFLTWCSNDDWVQGEVGLAHVVDGHHVNAVFYAGLKIADNGRGNIGWVDIPIFGLFLKAKTTEIRNDWWIMNEKMQINWTFWVKQTLAMLW